MAGEESTTVLVADPDSEFAAETAKMSISKIAIGFALIISMNNSPTRVTAVIF